MFIKPNSDGTFDCLTTNEFFGGKNIHPFLENKIKVCEMTTFNLIITYTKLTTTSIFFNLMDKRNLHLSSKAHSLLIISIYICCILIVSQSKWKFSHFSFSMLHTRSSILFGVVTRMTNSKVDVIFVKFSGQVDAPSGNCACFYIELHHSP